MGPSNSTSDGIPNAISHSNFVTILVTISKHTNLIAEANYDHSHCHTLLQGGRVWQRLGEAVGM